MSLLVLIPICCWHLLNEKPKVEFKSFLSIFCWPVNEESETEDRRQAVELQESVGVVSSVNNTEDKGEQNNFNFI